MFLNRSVHVVSASQSVSQSVSPGTGGSTLALPPLSAPCSLGKTSSRDHRGRITGQLKAVSVAAGILTGDFSAGQVLRVPLLASGHRPVVHMSIARRALLKGRLSSSAAPAG